MIPLNEDCSLRMPWAFSASFQNSGFAVIWLSSSIRFCFPSRSKTPPQKFESLFQADKLFFGFF